MEYFRHCLYIEPLLHVTSTAIGFWIGYKMHIYEETAEERTEKLLAKYKHAPRQWVAQLKRSDCEDDTEDGKVCSFFVSLC